MLKKYLLLTLLLTASLLAIPQTAAAKTVISNDIVMDTTWTPEMSPIILEGRNNKHGVRNVTSSTIRVGNGATLTIEPGVIIMARRDVNFRITTQCMQGFNSGECITDEDGKIKRPQLIANGTAEKPIIFTSTTDIVGDTPKAGDWGTFTIDRRGGELRWVELRYGGGGDRTRKAFLEGLDLKFINSTIIHSAKPALRTENATISGSVIANSAGTGIYCKNKCVIRNNYIADNAGAAIELDTTGTTTVTGNFLYQNAGVGITSDIRRDTPTTISRNYFLENKGGIHFLYGGPRQKIDNNNFLRNKEFAIKADHNVSNAGKTYKLLDNWFGIDSGASNIAGPYFVSKLYDTSTYAADGHDFTFVAGLPAASAYTKYRSEKTEDTVLFEILVERRALIGDDRTPGSLQLYTIDLKNLTIKGVKDVVLAIHLPADQELLLCSVLHDETGVGQDYVFGTVCSDIQPASITYDRGRLLLRPKLIAALSNQKFYFVTALKVNTRNTASIPRLTLQYGSEQRGRPFTYTLGNLTTINKLSNKRTVATPTPSNKHTPTPTSPAPTPTATTDNTNLPLATGTVSRQIWSGVLQYVLRAGDGKNYVLYNSAKWREIDNFTKSNNKKKAIAVWGSWYTNRYGIRTGIKFTEFEIQ